MYLTIIIIIIKRMTLVEFLLLLFLLKDVNLFDVFSKIDAIIALIFFLKRKEEKRNFNYSIRGSF